MGYPQFDYRLGAPLTWDDVKAMQAADLKREQEKFKELLKWQNGTRKRKTQSGVPAIPLKEK